jgi:hypothetical protein
LVATIAPEGVDQAKDACRDQIVAFDVGGEASCKLPHEALHERQVCGHTLLELLLGERSRAQLAGHSRAVHGRLRGIEVGSELA